MFQRVSRIVVLGVLLALPSQLFAGGPPMLCLPLDGVTSENAQACSDLINVKLSDKIWKHSNELQPMRVQQRGDNWYLGIFMEKEIGLSDVEAALKDSKFSVAKDRLRLFGHAILEIEAPSAVRAALVADLDALKYVSIEESKVDKERYLVYLDMPYPTRDGRREFFEWDTFHRSDLSADQVARATEGSAKRDDLPSYNVLSKVIAKHEGRVKDVRWSNYYACRELGGVAVTETKAKTAAK